MILCVCHVVPDRDVDRLVAQGACTLDEVAFETGATTNCGQCTQAVLQRIERACALRDSCAGGCGRLGPATA